MGTGEDDALRGELIRQVAAALEVLVTLAERQRHSGEDTAWIDPLLTELHELAEQAHDVTVTRTIRDIVTRHGSGPWPAEDLAAIAGVDLATVRRILDALTTAGLAWPESGDETGP